MLVIFNIIIYVTVEYQINSSEQWRLFSACYRVLKTVKNISELTILYYTNKPPSRTAFCVGGVIACSRHRVRTRAGCCSNETRSQGSAVLHSDHCLLSNTQSLMSLVTLTSRHWVRDIKKKLCFGRYRYLLDGN